jgi:hypothetical protein
LLGISLWGYAIPVFRGIFAGGNIADEDLDVMMRALQDAYWIAKEKNKKFTPKKYRKD